ncbi:helix-turn-helix transcriptional regulator [Roseomonas sp. CCTCC AB2023176]|uniref:helix-turn-helix transcriptional regulator n=1 Tax=Roseomonas sp. CCTCC AB2023176 TaxID=3342640 RepID=UPI0035DA4452
MAASENGISHAISSPQVRAARALLDWTRDQLAERSGVPLRTLARLEAEEGSPQRRTLAAIRSALEAAGVEFTNGDAPGVRLRKG